MLLCGYSGDAVRSSRVTRKGVQVDNPCLALFWLVQNCVAFKLLGDAEVFERGLTARMLIFDSGARRELDNGQMDGFAHGERWAKLIDGVLERRLEGKQALEIPCTPEARAVFARFHNEGVELERGPLADLSGELSRIRENAIKVAGLFAHAECTVEVSAEIATRAVEVVRWCAYNYLGMVQTGRAERQREQFERIAKLLAAADGEMPLGVLDSSHGIKRARIEALIAVFPDELVIERRPQRGAGRPKEIARLLKFRPVNPVNPANSPAV